MSKFEEIRQRYLRGFISDLQLSEYLRLQVLTEEQYIEIYNAKHGEPVPPNEEETEVVEG